ncbi:MFS domain-containing protein [Fusarium keratoplasticum]|nr:MFS domain-containing protein [Fusarium keratoplasticum]
MASTSEASLWRDPYESVNLPGDKNPVNFSPGKKARVVAAGVTIIVNSALGSSLPSGAASDIAKEFCVTAPLQLVLLNSIYMLGFAIGPLIFGPLSEHVGRRIVLIGTYLAYMVFTLCCAKKKYQLLQELGTIFSRPFVMITKEPVVLFSALYLALIYSTLYLFFQAYPIIFQGVYGLSYGEVGLTFLPVTAGSVLALVIFLCYSAYHSSAMKAGAPWAAKIEYRRLPLACAGGPMIVISLFWLGWTAYPSIHPAVPAVSGLFFGAGYLIIFIALLNYITDAYRQFSASAQASASTLRSITAVCLPLAAPQMYHKLGVQWACSLLAFVTLGLALIPFVFIRYGEALRKRSPFCQKLAQAPSMIVAT